MKKSPKRIVAALLTTAAAMAAVQSLGTAQALQNPRDQLDPSTISEPGLKSSDDNRYINSVVIVAGFTGTNEDNRMKYNENYDWSKVFFDTGKETMNGYYRVMSHGKFQLEPVSETEGNNDGVVHVMLPGVHWDAKDDSDLSVARKNVSDAIKASENYVDYARYDINGSGMLEADEIMVTVIFAGYEYAARSKNTVTDTTKMSQAHFGTFLDNEEPVVDNKKVKNYLTGSENMKETADKRVIQSSIDMLSHESLHYFGIPDFYSYNRSIEREWAKYRCECLSVMARTYGVFVDENGSPDLDKYSPYSLDPWSRIRLGWAKATPVPQSGIYEVNAYDYDNVETQTETILRIDVDPENKDEYFLIENRRFKGYDEGMKYDPRYIDNKYGGGIIIWHVDESVLRAESDTEESKLKDGTHLTFLNSLIINESNHRPAIMPVFIENDNTQFDQYYSFFGSDVNYRTGIHSKETLTEYGFPYEPKVTEDPDDVTGPKIDLVRYLYDFAGVRNDPQKTDRVCDRYYAGISVTPDVSSDNMKVKIDLDDYAFPKRMKAVYLERTDEVFKNRRLGQSVGERTYLYAYDDAEPVTEYKAWPGVEMEPVKDNLYVAYVPVYFNCFVFNDGEENAARSTDLYKTGNNMIYTANGWKEEPYQKTRFTYIVNGEDLKGVKRGDINLDGVVDIKDATQLQLHLAQYNTLNRVQRAVSDADNDGHVNVTDVTIIQKFIASLLSFDHLCGKVSEKVLV